MMDHLDRVLKRKRGLHEHFMIILGSRILRSTLSTVLLRLISMCLVDYFLYIFTWMLFYFHNYDEMALNILYRSFPS
ncbi:hypothetical protein Pint_26893 [Pistacia integerrima]|uniref:Uncharacterized protein n=1 Tax=Pistacia integerrima TaxID=434235 RepID=A0ACC0YR88_9ROSI|nr:hypothetical protein Pint_26893 [Pistacia integerrima]